MENESRSFWAEAGTVIKGSALAAGILISFGGALITYTVYLVGKEIRKAFDSKYARREEGKEGLPDFIHKQ